jgi:hypothetical protein
MIDGLIRISKAGIWFSISGMLIVALERLKRKKKLPSKEPLTVMLNVTALPLTSPTMLKATSKLIL